MPREVETPRELKTIKRETELPQRNVEGKEERDFKSVSDTVDHYVKNQGKKETISDRMKKDREKFTQKTGERAEVEQQIVSGQDVIQYKDKSWKYTKLPDRKIILISSAENRPTRQFVTFESSDSLKTSEAEQAGELNKLWTENKTIEDKFGGKEKFAEVQKKVEEIKQTDQALAVENKLKATVEEARGRIHAVDQYAGLYGANGQISDVSRKVKISDMQRFSAELLDAEELLKRFLKEAKPNLEAKKQQLIAELNKLSG